MSEYLDKVLNGEAATAADWQNLLLDAHRREPSMSPAAFADCRNSQAINSYEWLAKACAEKKPSTIVDLACGDGYLIPLLESKAGSATSIFGLDMSDAELANAQKRNLSKKVKLCCVTANAMGLASHSVDGICCHMAFMLMYPIEPVVSEILRVLKPGGFFFGVIGDRNLGDGLFGKIQITVGQFLKREFPKLAKPLAGDPRMDSDEGLREILSGFSEVKVERDKFEATLDPLGVWDHIKNMYLIGALPEGVRNLIKTDVLAMLQNEEKRGPLHLDFRQRLFTARV